LIDLDAAIYRVPSIITYLNSPDFFTSIGKALSIKVYDISLVKKIDDLFWFNALTFGH
jgi:hypothetical protein